MNSWRKCENCQGRGKKSRRIRKKKRLLYRKQFELFEKDRSKRSEPIPPKGHLDNCSTCSGRGIIPSEEPPKSDISN